MAQNRKNGREVRVVKVADGGFSHLGVTTKKLLKNEAKGVFKDNDDTVTLDRDGPDVSSSRRR